MENVIKGQPEVIYKLHAFRSAGRIVSVYAQINKNYYIPTEGGVNIFYPCGTKRFISNNRYD